MKLKWGEKREEEFNDWTWWGIFAAMVVMIVVVILKMLGVI